MIHIYIFQYFRIVLSYLCIFCFRCLILFYIILKPFSVLPPPPFFAISMSYCFLIMLSKKFKDFFFVSRPHDERSAIRPAMWVQCQLNNIKNITNLSVFCEEQKFFLCNSTGRQIQCSWINHQNFFVEINTCTSSSLTLNRYSWLDCWREQEDCQRMSPTFKAAKYGNRDSPVVSKIVARV